MCKISHICANFTFYEQKWVFNNYCLNIIVKKGESRNLELPKFYLKFVRVLVEVILNKICVLHFIHRNVSWKCTALIVINVLECVYMHKIMFLFVCWFVCGETFEPFLLFTSLHNSTKWRIIPFRIIASTTTSVLFKNTIGVSKICILNIGPNFFAISLNCKCILSGIIERAFPNSGKPGGPGILRIGSC